MFIISKNNQLIYQNFISYLHLILTSNLIFLILLVLTYFIPFFFLFQYSFLGRRQKAERAWRAGDLKDICRLDSATNFFSCSFYICADHPGGDFDTTYKRRISFPRTLYTVYMQKVLKIFASPKEILQNAFYYVLVKRGVGGLISI